jgi:putative ABC transport system permease protein
MFKNYFKTAFRNLARNKRFSAINILGLMIGLTTCLLITLFVKNELSYDRFNKNADRIYRINAHSRINGSNFDDPTSPAPLGPAMVQHYPAIENYVRIQGEFSIMVRKGNETLKEPRAAYADSTLFEIFTFPMIEGNPVTALKQPHSIVISESMAQKYFGTTNVLGNTLYINNSADYKITGVIKDMPAQSSFHFDFILPMCEKESSRSDFWLSNSYFTFLLARPGVSEQSINSDLKQATLRYAGPQLERMVHTSFAEMAKTGQYYNYLTIPLTKIHLYSPFTDEMEPGGNIEYVYIFIAIAVLILIIACINFTNLATAQSAGRAKEVGIRKVLGSNKRDLIFQFLIEAMITSSIAMVLSVLLTAVLIPYFNQLSGKQISLSILPLYWLIPALLVTMILVGLLAGSYPAFFLSRFAPVKVLKGNLSAGFKSGWLRNGLVVFQFVTAVVLIAGTFLIYRQLHYMQNKNLGYDKDHVLVLHDTYLLGSHAKLFKNEVLQMSGVIAGTMSEFLPTNQVFNSNAYCKNATMEASQTVLIENWGVDADFISTLGMQMEKGRNFSSQMPTDSSTIIINEATANALGYKDAIGKKLYTFDSNRQPIGYTIIGIVKDFNVGSLQFKTGPILFNLSGYGNDMAFRIHSNNIPGLMEAIKAKYHAIAGMAGQPFTYSFLNEDYDHLYHSEQRMGKIFIFFAILAIFIACLGLFGLITYAAKQRTKEIGIRKTLGASVLNIVSLLSKDFIMLILVAIIIAVPLSWFGMHKWLQNFAYRINISWWIFLGAGILAIMIALITVSFQAIKAAVANPVEALRSE